METLLGNIDRRSSCLVGYQYTGDTEKRIGRGGIVAGCPEGIYPCKDGYWDVMGGVMWWQRNYQMIGSPAQLSSPHYGTQEGQIDPKCQDEILAVLYPWAMARTKQEVWDAAMKARAVAAPLYNTEDLIKDAHFKERGFFVEIDHPETGKVKYPGPPFCPSETPWQIRSPAPLLGQHNEEVYGELGYGKEDLVRLRAGDVI